jgi:SAM-dependent methyltransferase
MYELIYGNPSNSIPWEASTHEGLMSLVESGRINPCRAIDLGCGTARNVVYLAQHGFDVTGVDFIAAAIELGRIRAQEAGVEANLVVDDLTNLQHINGAFDLLVDYGTLDDLSPSHRDLYMKNVLPLTHPGSLFLLVCGEWSPRWWERLFLNGAALAPGEVEHRFGEYFEIEVISKIETGSVFMPMWATYLMTRNLQIKGENHE